MTIWLHARNTIAILGSIVNIIGGLVRPFNEHKNLHFDNKWNLHMSSKYLKKIGYGLNLNLLAVSH